MREDNSHRILRDCWGSARPSRTGGGAGRDIVLPMFWSVDVLALPAYLLLGAVPVALLVAFLAIVIHAVLPWV
jgi:hypothetical protein